MKKSTETLIRTAGHELVKAIFEFTATKKPTISNYQDDQTDPEDETKTINYAKIYGQYPDVKCIIIYDENNRYQFQMMPSFTYVNGLIDTIYFNLSTEPEFSGYLILS